MAEQPGKYRDFIRKAREPESHQPIEPENQQTREPDEKMVNLCVKIPESLRRHWASQSKLQGITMTEVITEALTSRFGKPDNQITR